MDFKHFVSLLVLYKFSPNLILSTLSCCGSTFKNTRTNLESFSKNITSTYLNISVIHKFQKTESPGDTKIEHDFVGLLQSNRQSRSFWNNWQTGCCNLDKSLKSWNLWNLSRSYWIQSMCQNMFDLFWIIVNRWWNLRPVWKINIG